jgi:dihydrofolate reductase
MRRITVFNHISLDGYFVDNHGDMSWAHHSDPEFAAFTAENASGGGELLFGRVTYDLMVNYWPTPAAIQNDPIVAESMNNLPKIVFSRTMDKATWKNTRLMKGNLEEKVRKLKQEPGKDMVIFGNGTIVSQLAQASLIDEYQFVVNPIVLGQGRTLFEGITKKSSLKLIKSRNFTNGIVFLCYEPSA